LSKSIEAEGDSLAKLRDLIAAALSRQAGSLGVGSAGTANEVGHGDSSSTPDEAELALLATKIGLAGLIGADSSKPHWQTAYLNQAKQVLVQLAELRKAQQAFDSAGVKFLAYKGLPLAVRTAGDVVARGAGDNDILVAPRDLVKANAALLAAGFAETFAITPRDSFATRLFSWIHNELHFSTYKADLDLHWRLQKPVGTSPSFETLWERSVEIDLGGIRVRSLGDEDSLLTMAYQFYGDGCRSLKQQVDIWRLWNQLPDQRRAQLGEGMGYSRKVVDLSRAAVAYSAQTLGLQAEVDSLSPGIMRFLERIRRDADTEPPREIGTDQVSIMSLQQQVRSLQLQTSLGKPLRNLMRFTLDKLLDFRNQDLGNSVRSIFGALWREVRTQVLGRIKLVRQSKASQTRRVSSKSKFFRTLALAAVVVWLAQALVVKIYYVPSASMEPTLVTDGSKSDRLLVGKLPLFSGLVKNGTIVVFNKPSSWQKQEGQNQTHSLLAYLSEVAGVGPGIGNHLVKRVIAHGGQRVSCCDLNGNLLVDGKPQEQVVFDYPFQTGTLDCSTRPSSRRCFESFTVPAGKYLVLGDNRANSNDSLGPCRVPVPAQRCVRFVSKSDLVGLVLQVVWPLNRLGTPLNSQGSH
jgi:signal peptidase I